MVSLPISRTAQYLIGGVVLILLAWMLFGCATPTPTQSTSPSASLVAAPTVAFRITCVPVAPWRYCAFAASGGSPSHVNGAIQFVLRGAKRDGRFSFKGAYQDIYGRRTAWSPKVSWVYTAATDTYSPPTAEGRQFAGAPEVSAFTVTRIP